MFFTWVVLLAIQIAGSSGGSVEILDGMMYKQESISRPDTKDFKEISSRELEFRVDDYKTAFVGRVIDYQNPNNLNEFIRVYYRQIAIISERAREKNISEVGSRDGNLSNLNYHLKQEAEAISIVQKASDVFACVQWQTVHDSRTGQDVGSGFLRSWLLSQNGNWIFSPNHNLLISPLSEPSRINSQKRIIVGMQFALSGGVHIVRIDQDDLSIIKRGANVKK
jgi:hypothetical protein